MTKRRKLISILCIVALTVTTVMSTATLSFGATSKSKYWIKVNAQANVATVYKKIDKKWKPYRAMLCSCGTGKKGSGEDTPTGTYYVQSRWKWLQMVGGVYGRYVVQFYGDFLFHSVPYEYYGDLRTVDVAIRRLREKVEDNPADPKYIITKRGVGYVFRNGEV